MKSFLFLLYRDILPASSPGHHWRSKLSNTMVSLLPTCGLLFLLTIIAFIGLFILSAKKELDTQIYQVQNSPYMALFAEGFIYMPQHNNSSSSDNKKELSFWQNLKLKHIREYAHNVPKAYLNHTIFEKNKIFPFDWAKLFIKRKDGETLAYQKGMVLPFSGVQKDGALLNEIKKNLIHPFHQLPTPSEPYIILSEKALKKFRFNLDHITSDYLYITQNDDNPFIPFKILVARYLPYQFQYILSMEQWRRLDHRYYQKKIKEITIYATDLDNEQTQKTIHNLLQQHFPIQTIGDPFISGDNEALNVTLKTPLQRTEIIQKSIHSDLKDITVDLGSRHENEPGVSFSGAIFHINPVLHENNIFSEEFLYTLQEFMAKEQVKVRGELLQALQEIRKSQQYLTQLQQFFQIFKLLMICVIMIFFAMVLHTKMHRIGTLRMLGVSDMKILAIYATEAILFVCFSLLLGLCIYISFQTLQNNQVNILTWDLIDVMRDMVIAAEIGLVAPSLFFLKKFVPAEMVVFR